MNSSYSRCKCPTQTFLDFDYFRNLIMKNNSLIQVKFIKSGILICPVCNVAVSIENFTKIYKIGNQDIINLIKISREILMKSHCLICFLPFKINDSVIFTCSKHYRHD